jgi:hypothetical protein
MLYVTICVLYACLCIMMYNTYVCSLQAIICMSVSESDVSIIATIVHTASYQ